MIQIYSPEEKTILARAGRYLKNNLGWVVLTAAVIWSNKC